MRLPSVPLMMAAVFVFYASAGAPAARAASEGSDVISCADFGGPAPVPTPLDARRLAAEESYHDVFRILSTPNECSDFFGGPAKAATAFNHFSRALRRAPLDNPRVALRMSGDYVRHQDHTTGASYRLFEQATLNSHGPFGSRSAQARVGRYPAHTPQARALALLHELGHLVQGPSGGWLLPNDGGDAALSERNTRVVEDHCLEQLEAIRD